MRSVFQTNVKDCRWTMKSSTCVTHSLFFRPQIFQRSLECSRVSPPRGLGMPGGRGRRFSSFTFTWTFHWKPSLRSVGMVTMATGAHPRSLMFWWRDSTQKRDADSIVNACVHKLTRLISLNQAVFKPEVPRFEVSLTHTDPVRSLIK